MGLAAGVAVSGEEDNGVGGGSCNAVVPSLGYRAFLVFILDFLIALARLQK